MRNSETMTILQWCETNGVSPETIRVRFAKLGLSSFAKHRELSPDEIAKLESANFRGKAKQVRETSETADEKPAESFAPVVVVPAEKPAKEKPAQAQAKKQKAWSLPSMESVVRFLYSALAVCIVVGHGFMIWQEAWALYGYLGAIAGCIVFMVVCLALLLSADKEQAIASDAAIWFMFLVDAAAIRVHYETMARPDVPFFMTVGFCIFIAGCSWIALYLFRETKNN